MKFRQWFESQWTQATPDDYSALHVVADYVEERPETWREWFELLKGVVIGFLRETEALHNQLSSSGIWVDELEDDPLESMQNWMELHMLQSIHRVLDDGIAHNGPLFSVANAIKNSHEGLSSFLQYRNYYETPDDHDPKSETILNSVNQETFNLVKKYLTFFKDVFPLFLRVIQGRWTNPTNPKNSFERLQSLNPFAGKH